jgi:hypothetical protein
MSLFSLANDAAADDGKESDAAYNYHCSLVEDVLVNSAHPPVWTHGFYGTLLATNPREGKRIPSRASTGRSD